MRHQEPTLQLIVKAISQREITGDLSQVCRLFNGFYEGWAGLVIDRFGASLVIFNHQPPGSYQALINEISGWALENLKGIHAVLLKERMHPEIKARNGILIAGKSLASSITELGVHYALELQMHQDASFYPDTRNLRQWLVQNSSRKRVLNTFAYTGSLGVAAGAGEACEVVQTDLNRHFLEIAQRSWQLNELPGEIHKILPGDFFRVTASMRRKGQLFDVVILDPPFFSVTEAGRVDMAADFTRLVDKVRPLVAHEGFLVIINNALFLSGKDFIQQLNKLCESEFLSFEKIILIPQDLTGYPETIVTPPPVDPSPFNHPTKIAILRVFRKDKRF